MKHLPNLLTGLRLLLAFAMFGALVMVAVLERTQADLMGRVLLVRFAVAAFLVAGATDFFDGWLARRWKVTSTLGAVLDPIADKILVCGAILGLMAIGATPEVILFSGVILFREFAVSALREVLAPRGLKLPVTLLAKIKTTLQLVGLAALMIVNFWPAWGINARIDHLHTAMDAAELLYGLAALVTLWTGLEYARSAYAALKGAAAAS
jgi:CDP-diacylglycerol--glycerol-3-phosphate 3-phosphatidyltransferase